MKIPDEGDVVREVLNTSPWQIQASTWDVEISSG